MSKENRTVNLWFSKQGFTGRSDAALRIGVLISAVFVLVVFVGSVPAYIAQLRTICAGSECNTDQLTAESARALGNLGLSVGDYAAYFGGFTVLSALIWFGVAAVIVWRKFNDTFALFVALTLVLVGTFSVTGSVDAGSSSWWLAVRVVSGLELVCFMLFLCLFPDGRFVPRWTMWVAAGAALMGASSIVFPENPLGPLWFVFAGSLLGAQVYRYRRASSLAQRQQTKWVVFAVATIIVTVLGMFLATQVFSPSGTLGALTSLILAPTASVVLLLVPLSIGIAILRYRLFDIDFVINRTLVYGALTSCVVGLYVLIVGYLGVLFRVENNLAISLVATGLVAVLFAPLRDRLQRGVNRLMYGERDDPYAVISRLGQRLKATDAPEAVLPAIVETVAQALKLPHVAITLKQDGEFDTVAEYGSPTTGKPLILPLTYGTETIGRLVLSPRAPGESFSPADTRLLDDLARHAEAAAYAVRLTADLQRSRERLVNAREEERRRMRRDLHDGLGPQLATLTLKLDAARNLISQEEPKSAGALLAGLKAQTQEAISDIRRLVYDLRPPSTSWASSRSSASRRPATLKTVSTSPWKPRKSCRLCRPP